MTLLTLDENEVITVRVYKKSPLSQIAWANNYEFINEGAIADEAQARQAISSLIGTVVDFERSNLLDAFLVDRVVVSTYVPDGEPYNPFSFITTSVNLPGLVVNGSATIFPLNFAVLIKRIPSYGRQGSLLLRGIINSFGGTLTNSGAVLNQGALNDIQQRCNQFMDNLDQNGWRMVLARGKPAPTDVRPVNLLVVKASMSIKKLNNRYYDVP